jgi:hypothetical protein
MLTKRIIPCLDVDTGRVVKGVKEQPRGSRAAQRVKRAAQRVKSHFSPLRRVVAPPPLFREQRERVCPTVPRRNCPPQVRNCPAAGGRGTQ